MVSTTLVKKFSFFGLGLIILVGAWLRLYRISSYMTFLGDEGRDVLVVRNILLGKNFPLIGPGTSVGNMYLGPLYYYLISPSLLLTHFSPVGPAIFVAMIGLLTIGLLWWVCMEWGFGSYVSLAVSAIYAVSPVVVIYSRSSWNPNIMPFFALLCIYGIWRVWRRSDWKWLVITAISFAFVLNSHYLGLLLAPTLGLYWFLSSKKSIKISILSAFLLLLLLSPLFLFDLRHNWINFNALRTFFFTRQQTVNIKAYKALPNLWPIWTDLNSTLLTAKNIQLGYISSLAILFTLSITLTKQIKSKHISPELLLVLSWLGFGLIGLGLYKQHIYAHYYGFIFPAPFLLLGLIINKINRTLKYIFLLLLLLLLTFNLLNNPLRGEPNNQLTRTRQVAEYITAQAGGQPFNLALISNYNYDASYRYFLALNNSPYYPLQEMHTNQLFVICEVAGCVPINNPLYEIAAFGWAKIDKQWSFPWQVKVYKLIPNPSGS